MRHPPSPSTATPAISRPPPPATWACRGREEQATRAGRPGLRAQGRWQRQSRGGLLLAAAAPPRPRSGRRWRRRRRRAGREGVRARGRCTWRRPRGSASSGRRGLAAAAAAMVSPGVKGWAAAVPWGRGWRLGLRGGSGRVPAAGAGARP